MEHTDLLTQAAMSAATGLEALAKALSDSTEEQLRHAAPAFAALDQSYVHMRQALDGKDACIHAHTMAGALIASVCVPMKSQVSELRSRIAASMEVGAAKVQLISGADCMEDNQKLLDFMLSPVATVTAVVVPITPSHAWDFRGCQGDVPDTCGSSNEALVAHLEHGARGHEDGVVLEGNAYMRLDPWSFGGGPLAVEMSLVIGGRGHGYVFALKDGPPHWNPRCFFSLHVHPFRFLIGGGTRYDLVDLPIAAVPFGEVFHLVLAYELSQMQVFINGKLAGTQMNCIRADTAMAQSETRCAHWLGRSHHDDPARDTFNHSFEGRIGFFRFYESPLHSDDVSALYEAYTRS